MRHLLLIVALCTCAAVAFGQVGEISVSGGVSHLSGGSLGTVGTTIGSGDITTSGGFRFAVRLTLNTYKFFGHEFGYGYAHSAVTIPGGGDVSVPMHSGFYDFLVYATPEGSRIRPFATGGVQFTSFFPPGTSAYYGNQITKFGVNYGGGLKFKITSIIGGRLDFRQYNMGKPFDFPNQSGRFLQNEYTVGASFNF